jgi:hypothetical protein
MNYKDARVDSADVRKISHQHVWEQLVIMNTITWEPLKCLETYYILELTSG